MAQAVVQLLHKETLNFCSLKIIPFHQKVRLSGVEEVLSVPNSKAPEEKCEPEALNRGHTR
jgi:hypothetical protein